MTKEFPQYGYITRNPAKMNLAGFYLKVEGGTRTHDIQNPQSDALASTELQSHHVSFVFAFKNSWVEGGTQTPFRTTI